MIGLDVRLGAIDGEVLGSRPDPYQASITLSGRDGAALVPAASSLRFSCTCPDWDEPCKHAVAVALAFAERIRIAPDLLEEVTGVGPVSGPPARATAAGGSSQATTPARHLRLVTAVPDPDPLGTEVAEFLDRPAGAAEPGRPELAPVVNASFMVGEVDVGELVADAIHWLSVLHR